MPALSQSSDKQPLTVIESIATANPPHCVRQADVARTMQRADELSPGLRKRIPYIYSLSGIERRFTCVADYAGDPDREPFEPREWPISHYSSTRKRNEHYKASVVPIAESAVREAILKAGLTPAEITHVIAVSCTGFFAPGLDIHLVKSLGMRAQTQRTLIGFMGCYAAFNALRVADAFCKAAPHARVLIVCAELCSLHFQVDSSIESVVVNSLFADGVAAAVLRRRAQNDPECAGKLAYLQGLALLDDDSMEHMSWSIGDEGFLMGLSPRVPDVLAKQLPIYIEQLAALTGVRRDEIGFWAIHPGGRQIVDKAQESLGLTDDEVRQSFEILRDYGNMSAPTVLFILERIMSHSADREELLRTNNGGPEKERKSAPYLRRGRGGPYGVAMAFGPGLTIEGCLLQRL